MNSAYTVILLPELHIDTSKWKRGIGKQISITKRKVSFKTHAFTIWKCICIVFDLSFNVMWLTDKHELCTCHLHF